MATVFLAEDLKHHRQVAIKVLHPELAAAARTSFRSSTRARQTVCCTTSCRTSRAKACGSD
jgi:hypothetical protein